MACVNPDGILSPLGHAILRSLSQPKTAEELSNILSWPLFRVRSSLRELLEGELVEITAGGYIISVKGKTRI